MSISVQSRKSKGRKLQQWIARKISELLQIPWGKDELISSREMSQSGTDVRLIGKAKEGFPYSVECFVGSTLVVTKDGLLPIKEIKVGNKVLTHKGRFRKVTSLFGNGKKRIYEIKTAIQTNPIGTTINHRFETFGGKFSRISELDYLSHFFGHVGRAKVTKIKFKIWNKEDYKFEPKIINKQKIYCACGCGGILNRYDKKGRSRKFICGHSGKMVFNRNVPEDIVLDSDLMYLFGLYIAEGHISHKEGRITFTLHKDEKEYQNKIVNIVKRVFNLDVHFRYSKISKAVNLNINSVLVAKFFYSLLGTGSMNKKIGKFMFYEYKYIIPLLVGYFDGDGCIGDGFVRCETVSKRLAYEVQFALLRLGIFSKIFLGTKRSKHLDGKNPLYSVYIEKSFVSKFKEIYNGYKLGNSVRLKDLSINISYNNKLIYDLYNNSRVYTKIKEKKETYIADVYNLAVGEDESYVIEGGVVVHNCKNQETWAVPAWIKQAKSNKAKGTDWLLFIKKNRHEEIAILDAEAFFRLCEKAIEKEKK